MSDNPMITLEGYEGLMEVKDKFGELVNKYPDKAGDLLRKEALRLRKDVVNETKRVVKRSYMSKRSLRKLSAYSVSQVKGYGGSQYVEISAKSPHFHFVEHGHVIKTKSGETRGFVQGYHMLENTSKKHEEDMPKLVESMIDELLKEAGL